MTVPWSTADVLAGHGPAYSTEPASPRSSPGIPHRFSFNSWLGFHAPKTSTASAGGSPYVDRTVSSSKVLSSLMLTKSRIAVPVQ
jgi:hypothetical protein